MNTNTLLIIILVVLLLCLVPFHDGYYGAGLGGLAGLVFIVLLVLLLTGSFGGPKSLVFIVSSLAVLFATGCTGNPPKTLAHSESTSKDWLDSGTTTAEKTTTKNPDGSVSTESKSTTKTPAN